MIRKNIVLKNTEVILDDSKVVFHQETSFLIKPYFREDLFINYDIDLSEVPISILNIPFVVNIYIFEKNNFTIKNIIIDITKLTILIYIAL